MDITYLGHSSFKIKGKKVTVVCDPFDSSLVGLKFPKNVEAGIVTVSHEHADHNAVSQISGSPFVVHGAGEYEINGVGIIGIPSFHDEAKGEKRGINTIYNIEVDGIHIVHLGDIGEMLSDKEIEQLGTVNILMIPVGGAFTITAKQASELIPEIEPSIVLPMHYGRESLNQKEFSELTPLSAFLKLMGQEAVVPVPKLSVTKDKLPEQMQVVALES
jgi:L-ascorbate metabolism protein UlaG (beta-lactamase superfamily)